MKKKFLFFSLLSLLFLSSCSIASETLIKTSTVIKTTSSTTSTRSVTTTRPITTTSKTTSTSRISSSTTTYNTNIIYDASNSNSSFSICYFDLGTFNDVPILESNSIKYENNTILNFKYSSFSDISLINNAVKILKTKFNIHTTYEKYMGDSSLSVGNDGVVYAKDSASRFSIYPSLQWTKTGIPSQSSAYKNNLDNYVSQYSNKTKNIVVTSPNNLVSGEEYKLVIKTKVKCYFVLYYDKLTSFYEGSYEIMCLDDTPTLSTELANSTFTPTWSNVDVDVDKYISTAKVYLNIK